jgi:hypothetical protein
MGSEETPQAPGNAQAPGRSTTPVGNAGVAGALLGATDVVPHADLPLAGRTEALIVSCGSS